MALTIGHAAAMCEALEDLAQVLQPPIDEQARSLLHLAEHHRAERSLPRRSDDDTWATTLTAPARRRRPRCDLDTSLEDAVREVLQSADQAVPLTGRTLMITSEPRAQRDSKQHRRDVLGHMHRELATARTSADPWPHLERAHILSQPWAWPHTKVHAVMFRQALGDRDVREVMGQLLRLGVAGPGSLVGKYPAATPVEQRWASRPSPMCRPTSGAIMSRPGP